TSHLWQESKIGYPTNIQQYTMFIGRAIKQKITICSQRRPFASSSKVLLPKICYGNDTCVESNMVAIPDLQGAVGQTFIFCQSLWSMINRLTMTGDKINLCCRYPPIFECFEDQSGMNFSDISVQAAQKLLVNHPLSKHLADTIPKNGIIRCGDKVQQFQICTGSAAAHTAERNIQAVQ